LPSHWPLTGPSTGCLFTGVQATGTEHPTKGSPFVLVGAGSWVADKERGIQLDDH